MCRTAHGNCSQEYVRAMGEKLKSYSCTQTSPRNERNKMWKGTSIEIHRFQNGKPLFIQIFSKIPFKINLGL